MLAICSQLWDSGSRHGAVAEHSHGASFVDGVSVVVSLVGEPVRHHDGGNGHHNDGLMARLMRVIMEFAYYSWCGGGSVWIKVGSVTQNVWNFVCLCV